MATATDKLIAAGLDLDVINRKIAVGLALPILKRLKREEEEYYAERNRQASLPTRERSYEWQSYCRHGSYTGDPYGGDYLCYLCEDGTTVYEQALAEAWVKVNRWRAGLPHITALRKMGVLTAEQAMDMGADLLK